METPNRPQISRAESQVLGVVLELGQATVQQVLDSLPPSRQVGYATVQTLLRRLEKKGYLGHTSQGRAHVFEPIGDAEEIRAESVDDFVDRLYGGEALPLVQGLVRRGRISPEDIERLRRLLDEEN